MKWIHEEVINVSYYQILVSTAHGKTKNYMKTINTKYQEQHGGEVFELPDESYSAAKTQDKLQYLIKKKETLTNKLPV